MERGLQYDRTTSDSPAGRPGSSGNETGNHAAYPVIIILIFLNKHFIQYLHDE